MKLSTRTRYGMRLMVDLAEHWGDGYIALKDIAERQGISKKYLEQIVSLLANKGLLIAARGFSGGYQLSRDPDSITAADVVEATEGSLGMISCVKVPTSCDRRGGCPTLPLWSGLEKRIEDYLQGITLKAMAERKISPKPAEHGEAR